jgi:hypothetical protein
VIWITVLRIGARDNRSTPTAHSATTRSGTMNEQNAILNDIEPNNEMSIDELDAVSGGNIFLDIWSRIKVAICYKNGNCSDIATTLP